jgi:hypothetical protein
LRSNYILKHIIEGKIEWRIEVMGRWGRRCKRLLDGLKEKSGHWKLQEEALDRTLWRTRFRRGYGPVVRQTTEWLNECTLRCICLSNWPHIHSVEQLILVSSLWICQLSEQLVLICRKSHHKSWSALTWC